MGVTVYADDVVILAPSRNALVEMLKVTESFATEYKIVFSTNEVEVEVCIPDRQRSDVELPSSCDAKRPATSLGHFRRPPGTRAEPDPQPRARRPAGQGKVHMQGLLSTGDVQLC